MAAGTHGTSVGAIDDNAKAARGLYALLELSKALSSEIELDDLLRVIVENASAVVDAERTSIFVYDAERNVIWTRVAQGLGSTRIELPVGSGVAGAVARSLALTNISDAYADPRFNPESDQRSGFRTRSILAAPVLDAAGRLLGVVQSVNKQTADRFDADDETMMLAIASHVAVAIERARLTELYLTNERLEEALKLASDIQMRMLPPRSGPAGQPFDLQAVIRPAKRVGGDLYDFAVDGDRLFFCIGDVSGKGIGAALVMALTKTLFRANVAYHDDPAELMNAVNARLYEDTDPSIFVTAFCGFLNLRDGTLQCANAGHDRPFLLASDGRVDVLDSRPGIPLGVLPHFRYWAQQAVLAQGEALFLYTDGVTEATNANQELFTRDRLRASLGRCVRESVGRIVEAVVEDVDRFVEHAPQADDLAALCVRLRGAA
jgi:phosphoserine phosphatase RsbU/P